MTPGFAAFDADRFLREHWQKTPRLIRNPWADWRNPLDASELAGLAGEDGVDSRLVVSKKRGPTVEHGPFGAARFARLGKRPWTLLVQAVDHHVPAVAALLDPFRFVPNWRVDDVMVSVASDGGGVGPHFDRYDVFLVQGRGRRRWRVGARCDAATPLRPHDDLRLLADFAATDDWVLEPGDMLYVPPGFAHDGVAVGDDCMTYSIGFRAPSTAELVAGWCDHLLATLGDDDRYADPDLARQANPGEIDGAAAARAQAMVADLMLDRAAFARWFGTHATTPKYPEVDWTPDAPARAADLRAALAGGRRLRRNPASRFAFSQDGDGVTLFVDGDAIDCAEEAAALAERLCAAAAFAVDPLGDPALALLVALIDRGSLALDD